jgi:hypothetical protein
MDIQVVLIEPASIHTEAVDKLERDAERLLREADPGARRLYEDSYRRFLRVGLARERHGSPPQVVAEAVTRALAATRPRARYLVGKDSPGRWPPSPPSSPRPCSTPCAASSATSPGQDHRPHPQETARPRSACEPAPVRIHHTRVASAAGALVGAARAAG